MVDLRARINSLRLSWLKKFMTNECASWKISFSYWMGEVGGIPQCLQYNCNKKDMNILCRTSKVSYFYADLLGTWSELRYVDLFKVYNIKNETLWNNSNITYGNHIHSF